MYAFEQPICFDNTMLIDHSGQIQYLIAVLKITDNLIGSGGLANTLVSPAVHTKSVTSMHADNVSKELRASMKVNI